MTDFTQAVANRVGITEADAAAVLDHHNVRESGLLPRPHRLALTSLAFSGTKAGNVTGDFSFAWPLGEGLWCLAADNLKGKSTVLEVIWWCLRGENSRLQIGVRRWISHVRLDGQIDDDPFSVELHQNDGTLTGYLDTGASTPTVDFVGDAQFKAVMSEFMMDRLGLEILRSWRRDDVGDGEDGKAQTAGWPLFSHALISRNRNSQVLLGETAENGSVVSLLQMFIGLPWTSTRRSAETALKAVRQQLRGERRRATQDTEHRAGSLQELKDQLTAVEAALARAQTVPALEDQAVALETAAARVAHYAQQHAAAVQAHAAAQLRQSEVHQVLVDDRKALRDLRETTAAKRYFGALAPTCCPRCATPVVDLVHTRGEQAGDCCSVCGIAPPEDAPEDTTAIDQLTESVKALDAVDRQAQAAVREVAAARAQAESDLAGARAELTNAQAALPEASLLRRQLEVERLRGALQERAETHARAEGGSDADAEERILEAAYKEADLRAKKAGKPILDRISMEIYDLAVRLGYDSLQDVTLQGNGALRLHKDDGPTSFQSVSDGEQLRLRMATLLALLRVGQKHGGRHPGLLLIDSAGAQEMIPTDLAETLQQLQVICDETDGLQIIAATANRELARAVIAEDHAKIAEEGVYMW